MFNFLGLPPEIRNLIYDCVAFPPQQNVFEELRNGKWEDREAVTDYESGFSQNDAASILYSTMPVVPIGPNNATLQSMGKAYPQLVPEIRSFLGRSGRKLSYDLDVALISNGSLLPAWVSIPALDLYLDKLNVAVHPLNFGKSGCGPNGYDFSPLWSFYAILERFLKLGPRGSFGGWTFQDRQNSRCHRTEAFRLTKKNEILIKTLEIDIVTPKTEFAKPPSNNIENVGQSALAMSESLVKNFQSFFDTLLPLDILRKGNGWNNDSYEGLASILMYEHIGTIRLLHNGRFKREWDLGKLVETLELSSLFRNQDKEERYKTAGENQDRYFEYWLFEVQEYRARFAHRLSTQTLEEEEDDSDSYP